MTAVRQDKTAAQWSCGSVVETIRCGLHSIETGDGASGFVRHLRSTITGLLCAFGASALHSLCDPSTVQSCRARLR